MANQRPNVRDCSSPNQLSGTSTSRISMSISLWPAASAASRATLPALSPWRTTHKMSGHRCTDDSLMPRVDGLVLDRDVLALDVTGFAETLPERFHKMCRRCRGCDTEKTDGWPLLRARRERPSCRRAANERDELSPSHRVLVFAFEAARVQAMHSTDTLRCFGTQCPCPLWVKSGLRHRSFDVCFTPESGHAAAGCDVR